MGLCESVRKQVETGVVVSSYYESFVLSAHLPASDMPPSSTLTSLVYPQRPLVWQKGRLL